MIISSGSTIKNYFQILDINNDQLINKTEMRQALEKMLPTIKAEEISEIYELFDIDSDLQINLDEFVNTFTRFTRKWSYDNQELEEMGKEGFLITNWIQKLLVKIHLSILEAKKDLDDAFNIIDKDKNGTIDK